MIRHIGMKQHITALIAFAIASVLAVGLAFEMTADEPTIEIPRATLHTAPLVPSTWFDHASIWVDGPDHTDAWLERYNEILTSLPARSLEVAFKQDAIAAEGRTHTVYSDTRGKLTVGIGHEVTRFDNLKLGDTITDEQIDEFFDKDYAKVVASLDTHFPNWATWPELAKLAVANFLYQLGPHAPKKFPRATIFLNYGGWNAAADEWLWADRGKMRHSAWYHQTPARCQQEVNRLRAVAKAKRKEL